MDQLRAFSDKFSTVIIDPLLLLLFAAGLLVFIWGIVEYMWSLSQGENENTGKQHMLWGLFGMFVMVAAYSFRKIIANTLNVHQQGLF